MMRKWRSAERPIDVCHETALEWLQDQDPMSDAEVAISEARGLYLFQLLVSQVLVAVMLDLRFEPETFYLVIEKVTMDMLFVDSGDHWNPNLENVSKVTEILEGTHKVLKPNGVYISISFGQSSLGQWNTKNLEINFITSSTF